MCELHKVKGVWVDVDLIRHKVLVKVNLKLTEFQPWWRKVKDLLRRLQYYNKLGKKITSVAMNKHTLRKTFKFLGGKGE